MVMIMDHAIKHGRHDNGMAAMFYSIVAMIHGISLYDYHVFHDSHHDHHVLHVSFFEKKIRMFCEFFLK